MSGFSVDSDSLRSFAAIVDQIVQYFTGDGSKASKAIPSNLLPDTSLNNPNIGQRGLKFRDATDVYLSYKDYRDQFLGDPGQLTAQITDPSASSLAAFVSGLQHLASTATTIAGNYDKAQNEDHFDAAQVNALLNADPSTTGTGTGTGTGT